ncbi:MAG: winged-helix domain-containing protein, partial [Planctomycetota bacterium]
MDKKERNRTAILGALSKMAEPASSRRLAEFLAAAGHSLSERTVRLYLSDFDAEGLTESQGTRRRVITEIGIAALSTAQ